MKETLCITCRFLSDRSYCVHGRHGKKGIKVLRPDAGGCFYWKSKQEKTNEENKSEA